MSSRCLLPPELECSLREREPVFWLNAHWLPIAEVARRSQLSLVDVHAARRRLDRSCALLVKLFPELLGSNGGIDSPLYPADGLQEGLTGDRAVEGRWFIKADHALPVAGSVKARGGFYEVLMHAETLAITHGLLKPGEDLVALASAGSRALFATHQVAVGSTGNLGLGIGVMAAALGFRAVVHMSADAKPWKKERLRARGVEVIEHNGDFGAAVAAGRAEAQRTHNSYFVDDEKSEHLFLGYSVAGVHLQSQLAASGIVVDAKHPLFVYLPCGVGGAPGGITFGLRHLFGDDAHCFFAEPVAAPSMLVRLACSENRPVSVREIGLDNRTDADGLAVAQASEFVAPLMRELVSGVFTVRDDDLFKDLYVLERTEKLRIEPSAAAGFRGPRWLFRSEAGRRYLSEHCRDARLGDATHVLWTTGGAFVPDEEYRQFHERGRVKSAVAG